MSQDDVLFGYRLQLVDLAGRVGVTAACRRFGVHRSTYYAWKRKIEREGLRARRSRPASAADRGRARAPTLGRPGRVRERRLALPLPARPQHARETALARRRLRRAVRAAAS